MESMTSRITFNMKVYIIISPIIILFSSSASCQEFKSKHLFHIERSKNRNQVYYNILIGPDCKIKDPDPIEGFWMAYETDGKREEFNVLDKLAYRIVDQKIENNKVHFGLKALPKKKMWVIINKIKEECQVKPFCLINGKKAVIKKVYVFSKEGWVLPTVKYIDLFGELPDGSTIKEKIIP